MNISDIFKRIIHQGLENVFSRYYSVYRAYVYSNDDPENLNRLQLIIPVLNPNIPDETWAYPKNNFSGFGYGLNVIPSKGDMVWVEFEFGDPDNPVWSHGHYGKNEKPSDFHNKMYGFKTPAGNIIYIDDTKDQEEIAIKFTGYSDWIKINKDLVAIESTEIKLGDGAQEPVLLGDTTKGKLEEILDLLSDMNTALASHSHPGNGAPPTNAASFTTYGSNAGTIKGSLLETLSNKVKTE